MSGVQGSFKFPSIMKRRKIDHCLPTFSWELLKHVEEIGSVAFGSIYSAIYGPEEKTVVVKKLKGESTVAKDRFIKKAKLLYGIKHSNIPAI